MYYIAYFKDNKYFVDIGELGLTLDKKYFAPNGYNMDDERSLKSAAKSPI